MGHVRRALPLVIVLALVCANAQTVRAHPLLLRATPAPDTVLPSTPSRVQLVFSEDLTDPGSRLTVVDHDDHPVTAGHSVVTSSNPRVIEVRLSRLRPGSYLVSWTVVSADDGHVVHGSYVFSVKVHSPEVLLSGSSSGGQGFPDPDTLVALLAHWLLLLAAVTWFGSAALSVVVVSALRRVGGAWASVEAARLGVLIRLSAVILLATNVLALLVDAHQFAGEDWSAALSASTFSDLLASQHGQLWIAQQVVAILALATTVAIPTQLQVPRWLTRAVAEGASWHIASWVQIPLGIVYLYVVAASGHAASANVGTLFSSHLVSVAILVDLLHLLAVGLWLGGQIYIVLFLIPTLRPAALSAGGGRTFLAALDRFSPVAYASIALFTVTGPFNAKIHIPSWAAFFASTYGRALLVKLVLIALMMLISAFTVYTLRPRIRQALDQSGSSEAIAHSLLGGLLTWLRINPLLGAGVLLATSVMFFYPVPETYSQSAPSGLAWRSAGLSGTTVHFLVFGQRNPALGYAATEQGVYRLSGTSWQRVLATPGVWSVNLAHDERTVLAGDEAGDVYVSRDDGATLELVSGGALLWRLRPQTHGGSLERVEWAENRAAWIASLGLVLLCIYILVTSGLSLLARNQPDRSLVGIGLAIAALCVMPVLVVKKREIATKIGSAALRTDAACSLTCAYMAGALLVGLVLTAVLGWWWADAVAALGLLYWILPEAREAIENARAGRGGCGCGDAACERA